MASERSRRSESFAASLSGRDPFSARIVGSLETLIGGRNVMFTELAERTRREAFELMLAHAAQMGANAIVGIRYDATGSGAITEVLCYGTAVVAERSEQPLIG